MPIIYGVDTTQKFTARDVRDAIIRCFVEAHQTVLEKNLSEFSHLMKPEEFQKLKTMNVEQLIRDYFKDVGADYNQPDKDALIKVCNKLAELASQFRSPAVINQRYAEIMRLVEKL